MFVLGAALALSVAWPNVARAGEGVVTAPESIVRTAPFEVAPEITRLHAGDKVPADDKPTGTWRRVRLPDGRFGLVHDSDIQVSATAPPVAHAPASVPLPVPVAVVNRPPALPAPPKSFGDEDGFVLSAERLFGYVHVSTTTTIDGVDHTDSTSSITLLSNPLAIGTVYSLPRIAADYFAPHHVSFGGAAAYFHLSSKPDGSSTDLTYSGFLIAPRVGYAATLGPNVVMWPRLGFTLVRASIESGGTSNDMMAYALSVEVPVVFIVTPHVFLSLAPTLDVGLGGSQSASDTSSSFDESVTSFGLQAGLGAFF